MAEDTAVAAGAGEEPEISATSTKQRAQTVSGLRLRDLKAHPQNILPWAWLHRITSPKQCHPLGSKSSDGKPAEVGFPHPNYHKGRLTEVPHLPFPCCVTVGSLLISIRFRFSSANRGSNKPNALGTQ